MKHLRIICASQAGFSLIEIIVSIVIGAIVSVMFLSSMGTSLARSGDPINIARTEGLAETWMEQIQSDFVKEMNDPANYTNALVTIHDRDYSIAPYNMPASVTLTRTYITYVYDSQAGNYTENTGGGIGRSLKVTIQAGGYPLTMILTTERVSPGDPIAYY